MTNLENIEEYFDGNLTQEENLAFENRIINDKNFAEDVAFYISAKAALKEKASEDRREQFRSLYENQKVVHIDDRPKRIWKYLAAASVLIVAFLALWFTVNNKTPQQLASVYTHQNFKTLGVTMGKKDDLQNAIQLYNSGKLAQAFESFDQLHKSDTTDLEALKYTGITALCMKNYDKALACFTELQNHTDLFSNPGKFYLAITLLERNQKGDKVKAKSLLQQVVSQNLEGKSVAEKWLKRF